MLAEIFSVLQDSFKVPHLMEQGYKVNIPANYIHAYNEPKYFYHKTSKGIYLPANKNVHVT